MQGTVDPGSDLDPLDLAIVAFDDPDPKCAQFAWLRITQDPDPASSWAWIGSGRKMNRIHSPAHMQEEEEYIVSFPNISEFGRTT